jgi:nucleoside-diphosphate-sugar epimerase
MLELARTIIRLTGSRGRVVHRPLPPDDPKVRRPDISLARRVLGWEAKVPVEEGLRRTAEWFAGELRRAESAA